MRMRCAHRTRSSSLPHASFGHRAVLRQPDFVALGRGSAMALKLARRAESRPSSSWTCCAQPTSAPPRGADVLHLESASRRPPRPRACSRRRGARSTATRSATPTRSACRRCAQAIARHYRRQLWRRRRSGPDRRHHRLVGGLHPGFSRRLRAGRPGGAGGARLSRLSQHPHRARPRARSSCRPGRQSDSSRRVELLRRVGGSLDGLIVASPANPTGTMLAPDELAAHRAPLRAMRASASSPTRSITASSMAWHAATALASSRRARSSSTASRNISR